MNEAVYTNPRRQGEGGQGPEMPGGCTAIFPAPRQMPEEYGGLSRRRRRAACDIAGMSDRYAVEIYGELFIPKSWGVL